MSKLRVSIIILEAAFEGLAFRGYLEANGVATDVHLCGHPRDVLDTLERGLPADTSVVIISAHGSEKGVFFGAYGAGVDVSLLDDGYLAPRHFLGISSLEGKSVVLTACATGHQPFADIFLARGAEIFLAPRDYAEASDVLLFVVRFLHANVVQQRTAAHSAELAARDPMLPPDLFRISRKERALQA